MPRTFEIPKLHLAYFGMPLAGSLVLRQALQSVKNNRRIGLARVPKDIRKIKHFNLYDHARYANYRRFCLLRDPVERLLSAYDHCVIKHNDLAIEKIRNPVFDAMKVVAQPDVETFIGRLAEYRLLSRSVRYHTDLATDFLGSDLGYYAEVFRLGQMDDLAQYLGGVIGQEVPLANPDRTPPSRINFRELSPPTQKKLLNYCAGDYALMQGYYSDERYRVNGH